MITCPVSPWSPLYIYIYRRLRNWVFSWGITDTALRPVLIIITTGMSNFPNFSGSNSWDRTTRDSRNKVAGFDHALYTNDPRCNRENPSAISYRPSWFIGPCLPKPLSLIRIFGNFDGSRILGDSTDSFSSFVATSFSSPLGTVSNKTILPCRIRTN